jgi:hypothetical protein
MFCAFHRDLSNFIYIKKLAQFVLLSWTNSRSFDDPNRSCNSIIKVNYFNLSLRITNTSITLNYQIKSKKSPECFLNKDILDAVLNLSIVYDLHIYDYSAIYRDFEPDLKPIVDIIMELFSNIKSREKFILCIQFYSLFFNFDSPKLKQCKNEKYMRFYIK